MNSRGRVISDREWREYQTLLREAGRRPLWVPPAAARRITYAKIAWRFDTSPANLSEGEIVNEDGETLLEQLIWIGTTTSEPNTLLTGGMDLYREAVPQVGDDALYEVELVEAAHTRSGVERDLYRVIRRISGGRVPLFAEVEFVTGAGGIAVAWLGLLCDDVIGTRITTTLAGVDIDNEAVVLDAFAASMPAGEFVEVSGESVADQFTTTRYYEVVGDLPAGAETGVTAPAAGDVPTARVVGGVLRWKFEAPPGVGSGIPDPTGDPYDFLRLEADGVTWGVQPLGDIAYDAVKNRVYFTATQLQIGNGGTQSQVILAAGSSLRGIYAGDESLGTAKFWNVVANSGTCDFTDDATTVLSWTCDAVTPTNRKFTASVLWVHTAPIELSSTSAPINAKRSSTQRCQFDGNGLHLQYAGSFLLSTDKYAEIRAGAGVIDWNDDGNRVFRWTCDAATPANRKFQFSIPTLFSAEVSLDTAAGSDLKWVLSGGRDAVISGGATHMAFTDAGTTVIDWTLDATQANRLWKISIPVKLDDNVVISNGGVGFKVGFFGSAGDVQQTWTLTAATVAGAADAVYSANEITLINALVTEHNKMIADIAALKTILATKHNFVA